MQPSMPPATPPAPHLAAANPGRDERLYWAKILGIVGGAIILAGSAIFLAFAGFFVSVLRFAGEPDAAFVGTLVGGIFVLFALMGAALGIAVLMGAFRYEGPTGRAWAVAVLVLGCAALVTGAGFLLGAAAAIASGVLALLALPPKSAA